MTSSTVPMFSTLFRLLVFVSIFVGTTNGGPACSKKYQQNAECLRLCKPGWGFAGQPLQADQVGEGLFLGVDPWGLVIFKSGKTLDEWIASACGIELSSTSSTISTTSTEQVELITTSSSTPPPPPPEPTTISTDTPTPTPEPVTTTEPPPPPPPPPSPETTSQEPEPTPEPAPEPEPPRIAGNVVDAAEEQEEEPEVEEEDFEEEFVEEEEEEEVEVQQQPAPQDNLVSSSSSSGGDNDIELWLSNHNSLRARRGAGPLTWSNDAAAAAQRWADNCVFEHSGGSVGPFGENLAAGTGESYGVQTAFDAWADEESEYNPNNPQASHFTQVVWKETTEVGCALSICNGIFEASFGPAKYYVCEYSRQGNVIGRFPENV